MALNLRLINKEEGFVQEDNRQVYRSYRTYIVEMDNVGDIYFITYDYIKHNDWSNKTVSINRNYSLRDKVYLQDIYFEAPNKFNKLESEKYEIGTTSYGSLLPEEIDFVIEGYQIAKEVVELLRSTL